MIKSFNRQRKIVSLLLSLAMILTALPLAGFTAFAEKDGDFEYVVLEDGTAEITNYMGSAETLDIPSKLDTYTVTSIGDSAFAYNNSLTSVTIPNGVTNIDNSAFDLCYSLTEIKVDANNKNYSSQDGVLFNKNKTELIQYPIGSTRTSYDIPNSVISIGAWAFEDCENLTSVTIPESVTSIGEDAFSSCDSLASVTIGNGVTSIGGGAFEDCPKLTSVTIPNSVISIGERAFRYCDSLTSVTIPESVTSIGESAFAYCDSLTEIKVDTNNENFSSQDGVLFDKNKTELIQYPIGNERKTYDIPKGVTSIGDDAFAYCSKLTSVTIPESVTSIGDWAFVNCNGLTSITIPNGVTTIGDYAFDGCNSLASVTIPNGVTSIGDYAFDGCNSLASVTIPDSVTSIGYDAFAYCSSLTSITIPESVTSIGSSAFDDTGYYNNPSNWKNGVLYIDNCLIKANNDEILENCEINEGTRVIADYAFDFCRSLTSVTIPDSVTSIGEGAFWFCDCLTGVTIPDSVTIIGDSAFNSCYSLTDIYILNKDCNIVSSEDYYTIPTETTIHGYAGSTAEKYAKENGNKFAVINGEPVTPDPDKQNAIGDIDGNANITITDAKWILQNTVKSRTFTEAQAKAADLNKDGKITIVDAKWVLQIVVGLRDAQTLKPIKK